MTTSTFLLSMNNSMFHAMNTVKIFVYHVSISHSDLNAGVAEEFLHINDICIISE